MDCPFLIGRQIKMCGAFKATLVLSLDELEHQCSTPHYTTCRLYNKRIQCGAQLPLHEYGKERRQRMF